MKKYFYIATFILPVLLHIMIVRAEVVINGTRIVFEAKDSDKTVQLKSNASNPLLIQVWLDTGNPESQPGDVNVPFVITPPVVRMDAGKGQALRILKNDVTSLPQDRESLFWFNLLEIPPKPTEQIAANDNMMQIAFRTRIKMFYRPSNLAISPLDAYQRVTFSLSKSSAIKIRNNTPYFITFTKVEIKTAKNSEVIAFVNKFPEHMVSPGGQLELPIVNKRGGNLVGARIFYTVINDYGGDTVNEQILENRI